MINANLENIKAFLTSFDYKSAIIKKNTELTSDQLLIELEPDVKQRERFLLIRTAEQNLCSNDALLEIRAPLKKYQELQLIVTLPFYVLENKIPDIARLILLLNKGMEIPGFELSEVDHLIFFRYAFIVPEDQLDERILISLVGMIEMLIDTFSEILETVATASQSFQQLVEQVKKMIKQKNISSAAH